MSKYIDSEKLIKFKEILADIIVSSQGICTYQDCKDIAEREALLLIATIQQEQPVLPGIEDPGIPGKDFIPVEWLDACEMYGKWKIVKQEQPEVDLEKEITRWLDEGHITDTRFDDYDDADIETTARHFYELGRLSNK